ncbi:YheC/YheD family protein [Clostridium sp. 19966]|uniref:YheC/YheD family endospore coat-associated protein n=1 Tax=Clostridium sp. 19966 TaxID=2768166 RepID=UPI0028DD81CB|nr:YheC/YheD family protein [Clostridium sp. 19966]MDT8718053.1 YheC/YheD family protein [Clostridium sp. 19966]
MFNEVNINYISSDNLKTCYITEATLQQIKLSRNLDYITLSVASITIKLNIKIIDETFANDPSISFSNDLEQVIHIPDGTLLQINKINERHIELGPLIGIFVNQIKVQELISGTNISEYVQFDRACKKLSGFCYFFSRDNIDWENNLVLGIFRTNDSWGTSILPLAKVIYNRNVEGNCVYESLELKSRLPMDFIMLNNTPKLSKWDTMQLLKSNPELASAVPETVLYTSYLDVEKFLGKYASAYLKPNLLSKGRGVFKISNLSANNFKVSYRTKDLNHVVVIDDLKKLDILLNKYSTDGGGYIIQREIKKAFFRESPFDFRLLYQKDYKGNWKPGGIASRIAANGSIITSPRSGGSVEDFSLVLKEVFYEDSATKGGLYEKVINIGREICLSIEAEFGTCVELGIDMTIDVRHKIWIIEVNGKPLRVSLERLNKPEVILRCNSQPIEYCVYLSGFKSKSICC